jgi:hypothetical protein
MAQDLSGVHPKVKRADEHFEALQTELGRFWDENADPIERKLEDEGRKHVVYLTLRKEPDLARWGLLIGDCVQNLRAALDHVVYARAILESGQDPPPDERRLQFPICDTTTHLAQQEWRIASLSQAYRERIYAAQPYETGNDLAIAPLRLLRDMNDADKHRLVTPALFQARSARVEWSAPAELPESFFFDAGALKNNTEIMWARFREPKPDVEVYFGITLAIGLSHDVATTGSSWSELYVILEAIRAEVARVISDLEAVPTVPPVR